MTRRAVVTGSSGLVGSEMVVTLDRAGWEVVGADTHLRRDFFGQDRDTTGNLERLRASTEGFRHEGLDIRDRLSVARLVDEGAAQSHLPLRRTAFPRSRRSPAVRRLRRHCRGNAKPPRSRWPRAIYNIGGRPENSGSILEAIARLEELTARKLEVEYVEEARRSHLLHLGSAPHAR